MLDEGIVEAAQTLRALEDGDEEDFYPIEPSAPSPPSATSRRAIEAPVPSAKRLRDGDDGDRDRKRTNGAATTNGTGGAGANGLLSEDAMENLRFYADMARKQAEEDRQRKATAAAPVKAPPKQPTGLAALGGYGSGDESD